MEAEKGSQMMKFLFSVNRQLKREDTKVSALTGRKNTEVSYHGVRFVAAGQLLWI